MEKSKGKPIQNSTVKIDRVRYFAIITRIAVLGIQVISNLLIPDHEADAFQSPVDPNLKVTKIDTLVNFLFGGLKRWDAHFFLHISQYGYTHENTLAFFPVFPVLVRELARILYAAVQLFCNFHTCLLLVAVCFNFVLFVKAAIYLYRLSKIVLKDEELAYRSAILFCVNPASIFFSAPYSESLFWCMTCYSLLAIEERRPTISTIFFGLASGGRSNGLINAGFLVYAKLKECIDYFHRIKNATTDSGSLNLILVLVLSLNYMLLPVVLQCAIVFLPFALFQIWSYKTFCQENPVAKDLPYHLDEFLKNNFLHTPDLGVTDWCDKKLPIPYSSVQEKYWEVGPFRYYEAKQLPNFLLAMPIVLLVISHAALYAVDNSQICWRFGIQPRTLNSESERKNWSKTGINSPKVFVYTVHTFFLAVFCAICVHVQVTTRLICSSSPIAYWFAAYLSLDTSHDVTSSNVPRRASLRTGTEHISRWERICHYFSLDFPRNFWGQVVLSYFILYFFIGNILFSNFYPWT